MLWLAGATVAFLMVAAAVISLAGLGIDGGKSAGFFESFWQAMLRVFDSGTFSGDSGWALRTVSLVVTLAGILFVTSLIGLIASSIDQRVTNLGKGRSPVLETGHVVVLGWSPRLFSVLSELVEANANQRRAVIVILAEETKADMEDAVRARIGDTRSTRIVCRTGDPASPADLDLVNATGARSIVVMAGHAATGDAAAVRATLAVLSADSGDRPPVVVEMLDGRNARALSSAAGGRVLTVEADDIIAKVTAQACYQAGLGIVYRELLDFAGDEIYFVPAPELVGHTFGEALSAYETSTVVGRRTAAGSIALAPDMATVFEPGDQVIVVSADDDTIVFSGFRHGEPTPPRDADTAAAESAATMSAATMSAATMSAATKSAAAMLVIGWSPLGARILTELDAVATGPRSVDVAVDDSMVPPGSLVATGCEHLVVRFLPGADDPDRLGALVDGNGYDHVVVLGYRNGLAPAEADARTLLTLLTLAGRTRSSGLSGSERSLRVVAEVLDSRDAVIAERTGADDLVVSDQLSSLMIAQLTERPELIHVFDALFDPAAPSIAVRPAASYGVGGPLAFGAVVAAVRAGGEVALGYRLASGRVVINPPKSAVVPLGAADHVIVLG